MTISNTPPPEAIAAIESGFARILRRVELYEADGTTIWTPQNGDNGSRLITGNVSIDYSRDERRIFEVELDNRDGMLDADHADGFWYDKILKPYRGVRYPAIPTAPDFLPYADWEIQLGEFMIDRISDTRENTITKVSCRDYSKKGLKSKLENSMSFPAGTYIYELIDALAGNAGIFKTRLPFITDTIGVQLDLERGTERWKVMKDAALSVGYDLFFDNEGYLTMEKLPDPYLDAPFMEFSIGPTGNLVSFEKSVNDDELFNHVIVTSDQESVEGGEILLPYFGEAKNEDPNSPTNIDRIGDRMMPEYKSSMVTSDQHCRELAEALLRIHSLETYELNWSSLVYPHCDVGRVVKVAGSTSQDESIPTKFLLDTLTIPLNLEPMTATGKRVVIVR